VTFSNTWAQECLDALKIAGYQTVFNDFMTVAADSSVVLMIVIVGVAAGFSAMMARRSRSVERRVTAMVFSFSRSHITDLRATSRRSNKQRSTLHPVHQVTRALPVLQGLHYSEVRDGLHVFDLFTQTSNLCACLKG
jgi:hypothetical protein